MKTLNFFSVCFFSFLSTYCRTKELSKLAIVLLILQLTPSVFWAQNQCLDIPCAEFTGPIFPGGNTLCEDIEGFSADYVIEDGKYASKLGLTLWTSSTDFYGKDILIEGTFYLDIPVAFYFCRIKLEPGAEIIVADPGLIPTLTEILAFKSKFWCCDGMWKGITIGSGNRARIYSNHIEDAQFAITVDRNVSLALFGNYFNRNFVSITNAEENTKLPFLLFKNNDFNCTSELNDYFDLDFPNFNEDLVSFAGILLNDCSSSIGFFGSRN